MVDDKVRLTARPMEGVVDYVAPSFLGVGSGDAIYRFWLTRLFGGDGHGSG